MLKSNQPPDEAEDEPGDHEAGKEGEESVAPLEVQDGREHVLGENDNYSNNISTDSWSFTLKNIICFLLTLKSWVLQTPVLLTIRLRVFFL